MAETFLGYLAPGHPALQGKTLLQETEQNKTKLHKGLGFDMENQQAGYTKGLGKRKKKAAKLNIKGKGGLRETKPQWINLTTEQRDKIRESKQDK